MRPPVQSLVSLHRRIVFFPLPGSALRNNVTRGGDEARGRTIMFLHQPDEQTFRRLSVATTLENFIQDQPILVDRSPQPELTTFNRHNDLVEMPDIARLGLPTA